jgi:hypothetical protein
MSDVRHTRQVRLAEVGDAGQARIGATTAHVEAEGLAGAVEARYLAGAGVVKIATTSDAIGDAARAEDARVEIVPAPRVHLGRGEPPPFAFRDPAARDVAMGAWRALVHVRRAIKRGDES